MLSARQKVVRIHRLIQAIRTLLFVYVSALVVVVGSERMFWFWTPGMSAHLEGALVYSLPIAVVIWTIAWFRVSTVWALLAVVPLFAYVTEGVITPILYSGGPFVPFFPAWFAAWHGLGSVFLLWFCVRRWLLSGDWRALTLTSIGVGAFWGVWATTLRLPENVEDEELIAHVGELMVLGPAEFAQYATTFTVVLALSHLALSLLWPSQLRVRRRSVRLGTVLLLACSAAWTVGIPWALPMFAVYGGLQVRALRRHRRLSEPDSAVTIVDQLAGRFPPHRVVPLLLIAPAASYAYLLLWWFEPPVDVVRGLMFYGIIIVQTLVGGVVVVMAWKRAAHSGGGGESNERAAHVADSPQDRHRFRTIGT